MKGITPVCIPGVLGGRNLRCVSVASHLGEYDDKPCAGAARIMKRQLEVLSRPLCRRHRHMLHTTSVTRPLCRRHWLPVLSYSQCDTSFMPTSLTVYAIIQPCFDPPRHIRIISAKSLLDRWRKMSCKSTQMMPYYVSSQQQIVNHRVYSLTFH